MHQHIKSKTKNNSEYPPSLSNTLIPFSLGFVIHLWNIGAMPHALTPNALLFSYYKCAKCNKKYIS